MFISSTSGLPQQSSQRPERGGVWLVWFGSAWLEERCWPNITKVVSVCAASVLTDFVVNSKRRFRWISLFAERSTSYLKLVVYTVLGLLQKNDLELDKSMPGMLGGIGEEVDKHLLQMSGRATPAEPCTHLFSDEYEFKKNWNAASPTVFPPALLSACHLFFQNWGFGRFRFQVQASGAQIFRPKPLSHQHVHEGECMWGWEMPYKECRSAMHNHPCSKHANITRRWHWHRVCINDTPFKKLCAPKKKAR